MMTWSEILRRLESSLKLMVDDDHIIQDKHTTTVLFDGEDIKRITLGGGSSGIMLTTHFRDGTVIFKQYKDEKTALKDVLKRLSLYTTE